MNPNGEEWNGVERRSGGRIVYSRGPIIRTLEFISAIAGICAIIALIVSLSLFSDRLALIQQSRAASATDSCYLFRRVVIIAGDGKHHRQALAFLDHTGLGNCITYGRYVTKLDR